MTQRKTHRALNLGLYDFTFLITMFELNCFHLDQKKLQTQSQGMHLFFNIYIHS